MNRKYSYMMCAAFALSTTGSPAAAFDAKLDVFFKKQDQLKARDALSEQIAPIKSKTDLVRYLTMVPPKSNALYLLSPSARERFIASTTFNEKGLTGFSYADLQRELSDDKIAKVLALFGSESSVNTIRTATGQRAKLSSQGVNSNIAGCNTDDDDKPERSIGNCEPPGGWDDDFPGEADPPAPSPPPIPGQPLPPKPLPNGDYFHYECQVGGGGCSPLLNHICKAKC